MKIELATPDATELASLIRTKQVSPVEVLAAHRERADELNGDLNAIVTPSPLAEEEAGEAEQAIANGLDVGPLHGVPFTIKDCIDTAGLRTTRGSKLFEDFVPDADATVVRRLRGAGGVLLGKTNTPEFALWWETDNLVFGRTANPWNHDRTAGGSSGGEASAVAAGLSPFGLGSDLGGSIRSPAHYCGVCGLKATHGRVPLTGHFPDTIRRFMHVGPLARSVRDIALVLSVISGPDGSDWHAAQVEAPAVPDQPEGLHGIRVGVLGRGTFGPVEPEVAATVRRAADSLADLGARVQPIEIDSLARQDWNTLTMDLYGGEGRPYFEALIKGRHDELHPVLRNRLTADPPSLGEYIEAELAVEALREGLLEAFAASDVLLCHTTPVPAHPHGPTELVVDGEPVPPRTVIRGTIPFDLSGSPAMSVPYGWSEDGLPIGVQLVGRHFDEGTIFTVAMALEQQRPVPPPLS